MAMQKPSGYDVAETKTSGSFEKPQAGAYVFQILQAAQEMTKKAPARPMMVLLLDIAEGPFKGYYRQLFEFLKSRNADSKWPCVFRRCMDGDQLPFFKGDIKAIEESNQGFVFNFDEKTLKGKSTGCMLGEKEIDASGKTILEPRFLCSAGKARVGDMKAPKIKAFSGGYGGGQGGGSSGAGSQGFGQSNDPMDEDLPF